MWGAWKREERNERVSIGDVSLRHYATTTSLSPIETLINVGTRYSNEAEMLFTWAKLWTNSPHYLSPPTHSPTLTHSYHPGPPPPHIRISRGYLLSPNVFSSKKRVTGNGYFGSAVVFFGSWSSTICSAMMGKYCKLHCIACVLSLGNYSSTTCTCACMLCIGL
jgi:hypothetical protein